MKVTYNIYTIESIIDQYSNDMIWLTYVNSFDTEKEALDEIKELFVSSYISRKDFTILKEYSKQ